MYSTDTFDALLPLLLYLTVSDSIMQLHDVVRDFVVSKLDPAERRSAHRRFIELLRAQRPIDSEEGWGPGMAKTDPAAQYVFSEVRHHVAAACDFGSCGGGSVDGGDGGGGASVSSDGGGGGAAAAAELNVRRVAVGSKKWAWRDDVEVIKWLDDHVEGTLDVIPRATASVLGHERVRELATLAEAAGHLWHAAMRWYLSAFVALSQHMQSVEQTGFLNAVAALDRIDTSLPSAGCTKLAKDVFELHCLGESMVRLMSFAAPCR